MFLSCPLGSGSQEDEHLKNITKFYVLVKRYNVATRVSYLISVNLKLNSFPAHNYVILPRNIIRKHELYGLTNLTFYHQRLTEIGLFLEK